MLALSENFITADDDLETNEPVFGGLRARL